MNEDSMLPSKSILLVATRPTGLINGLCAMSALGLLKNNERENLHILIAGTYTYDKATENDLFESCVWLKDQIVPQAGISLCRFLACRNSSALRRFWHQNEEKLADRHYGLIVVPQISQRVISWILVTARHDSVTSYGDGWGRHSNMDLYWSAPTSKYSRNKLKSMVFTSFYHADELAGLVDEDGMKKIVNLDPAIVIRTLCNLSERLKQEKCFVKFQYELKDASSLLILALSCLAESGVRARHIRTIAYQLGAESPIAPIFRRRLRLFSCVRDILPAPLFLVVVNFRFFTRFWAIQAEVKLYSALLEEFVEAEAYVLVKQHPGSYMLRPRWLIWFLKHKSTNFFVIPGFLAHLPMELFLLAIKDLKVIGLNSEGIKFLIGTKAFNPMRALDIS